MTASPAPRTASLQIKGLVALMRPRQWVKNVFVLAPLIFTGEFLNLHRVEQALLAALLFCLASSATYVLNDLHDIERDRLHPRKSKTRPLAAGTVSVPAAWGLLFVLYGALILAWFLVPKVMLVIGGYLALNVAYTFVLKHQPVLDIFTIAFGFVLRVYAGAMALSVPVSTWMFVTTLCLALFLASIKRRQELKNLGSQGREVLSKYSLSIIDRYAMLSSAGALFFYSMFVMQSKPGLMVTIPIVLFGLFRYWYIVDQLDEGESPTDVLYADVQILVTVVVWIVACAWVVAGIG